MKEGDKDMIHYLKVFVFWFVCLLALPQEDNRDYETIRKNILAREIQHLDTQAIPASEISGNTLTSHVHGREVKNWLNLKNKLAYDTRSFVNRLKTLEKNKDILPLSVLIFRFPQFPVYQDDPPDLS